MKINKCTKLVNTVQNKEEYVIHIVALKQAIDHGLVLKKVYRVIEFKQARGMAKILYRNEY